MVSMFLFYRYIQCSSASNNKKRTNKTRLAHTDGPEWKKAKNEDDLFFTITLNVNDIEQQVEFYAKVIQNNEPDTYKYSIRSKSTIYEKDLAIIKQEVLLKAQIKIKNDKVDAHIDYSQEKEIFNNHLQKINEIEQDTTQKIETCKNIKKNAKNFLDLTEDGVKPHLKQVDLYQSKYKKIEKIKDHLKKNNKYTRKMFMKQDILGTLNLAEYMPRCITKYACNKETFNKQTEAIKTIFDTGVIDFDKFFDILDENIEYNDNDKEELAKLVDLQMNDFLQKNINSLTLLFPKMQFFMDYYSKYQDDLIFFEDTKHVCMVYGMMHILENILKCTEHMINEIKANNDYIIACSNGSQTYKPNQKNITIIHFLVTKCEIEKMLLYILQPFLPTDHFIDLVHPFHIESVCSFGMFRHGGEYLYLKKPSKTDSIMLVLSTYCYIYFDALETDTNGIQKKVTQIFFKYLINKKDIENIFFNRENFYILQDVLVFNNCFMIFMCKNVDKLSDNLKKAYIKLAAILNQIENKESTKNPEHDAYNCLRKEMTNSDNKTNNSNSDDKKCKRKRKRNSDNNVLEIDKYENYNSIIFYILNCMCNYIIACEATILMSYDITTDKSKIEEVITQNMEIIENWTNTKYVQKKRIDTDLSFKKPKFYVSKEKKIKK